MIKVLCRNFAGAGPLVTSCDVEGVATGQAVIYVYIRYYVAINLSCSSDFWKASEIIIVDLLPNTAHGISAEDMERWTASPP